VCVCDMKQTIFAAASDQRRVWAQHITQKRPISTRETYNQQHRPVLTQVRPMFIQKRSTCTQKRPIFIQETDQQQHNRTYRSGGLNRELWAQYFTKRRSIFTRQRPVFTHKGPMYTYHNRDLYIHTHHKRDQCSYKRDLHA